ncbi:MAG: CBS domain-containing protein [Ignavibacteriae bacterium]|nr:CBS domain-containing protein [Ignavibacteriota bacterium]
MHLHNILRAKGSHVHSVAPDKTVKEAVELLVEHNIGALLVVENLSPVGIITERDVLRLCRRDACLVNTTLVSEIMTRELIVGRSDDEVEHSMAVLTEAHIRHLPVLDGELIAGMISIGDLVKSQLQEGAVTIHYLRDYITGNRAL